MFEVGKKYKHNHLESMDVMTCVFVGERASFFTIPHGHTWDNNTGFSKYREIPPEPKRWSTYENVFVHSKTSAFESAIYGGIINHPSKETALANSPSSLGCVRWDYEQLPGFDAVCVKTTLEPR